MTLVAASTTEAMRANNTFNVGRGVEGALPVYFEISVLVDVFLKIIFLFSRTIVLDPGCLSNAVLPTFKAHRN